MGGSSQIPHLHIYLPLSARRGGRLRWGPLSSDHVHPTLSPNACHTGPGPRPLHAAASAAVHYGHASNRG